jgi:hypothetical protein
VRVHELTVEPHGKRTFYAHCTCGWESKVYVLEKTATERAIAHKLSS